MSVGMCLVGLFTNLDDRVVLTYAETFSDLKSIRDVFYNRANFTYEDNPAGFEHVGYPTSPETRFEVDDMQRRGLISNFLNVVDPVAFDVDILRQLMRLSWCSSGFPRGDELPVNRTPGCECIANAYVDFVRSAVAANTTSRQALNASNQTVTVVSRGVTVAGKNVIYVSSDIRQRVGDAVYRCWDVRQVTRDASCGRVCTTHVVGLALFADLVLFLVCVSFVAFTALQWNVFSIKLVLVAMGCVLSSIYLSWDAGANALSVGGLAVCLFYITVTLHEELDPARALSNSIGPNPLTTTLIVNLPLILSAHIIQIGVSGYGRDLWVFASFGFVGALLGIVLQVFFVFHPFVFVA